MKRAALIEQELSVAQDAWRDTNEGRARVCARRAVALAAEWWLERHAIPRERSDALAHLRRIQMDPTFPAPIRRAAERLSTPVTRRRLGPFSSDPVGDARLIVAHLLGGDLHKPSQGKQA